MIKAVFFDVDHTLFSHRLNAIPESAKKAIQILQKKGIYVFLATGRHRIEIEQLPMEEITFDGYITLSGQLCLDKNYRILYENSIHPHDIEILRNEFEKKEIPVFFIEENALYTNKHTKELEKVQASVSSEMPPIRELSDNKVYQVTLFTSREEVNKIVSNLIYSKCTGWNSFGSDVISNGGGKAKGIEEILHHYGIKKEETMAFGDGENDIDMLAYCQIGIAMGNAHEDLKKVADYITEDIDNNGVELALKHFGLI